MKREFTKKQIIIAIVVFALICVGAIIYALIDYFSKVGKIETSIYYAPFISKVTLNGEPVKNGAKSYITPGDYKLEVTLENFETITKDITISEESYRFFAGLKALNEEGEKIANQYIDDYNYVSSLYANQQVEVGKKERETWPILSYLPYKNSLFSIGYIFEDYPVITINATSTYLNDAVNKIKELCKDDQISSYDITFPELINPFGEAKISQSQEPIDFIKESYSNVDFTYYAGKSSGNYYILKLTTGQTSTYNLVYYLAIIEYVDSSWKVISTPQPILTTYNTPDVSINLLEEANNF